MQPGEMFLPFFAEASAFFSASHAAAPQERGYIPDRATILFLSEFIELIRSVLVFFLKGTSGFSEVRDGEQIGVHKLNRGLIGFGAIPVRILRMILAPGVGDGSGRASIDKFLRHILSRRPFVQSAYPPKAVLSRDDQVGYIGGELRLAVAKGDEKRAIARRLLLSGTVVRIENVQPDQHRRLRGSVRYPERQNDEGADNRSHEIESYREASERGAAVMSAKATTNRRVGRQLTPQLDETSDLRDWLLILLNGSTSLILP